MSALNETLTVTRHCAGGQRHHVRGEHQLQPRVGAERAGAPLLLLRPDQLRARRQLDVERRPEHVGAGRWATARTRTSTRSTAPTSARRRGRTPTRSRRCRCCQLGASAEYGNVQGAVFNIVTRQGSNAFHGDGNTYFQNDALTGRNTTDAVGQGLPLSPRQIPRRDRPGVGPFIADKFWFFGSLQYQRDWDSQPGVDPNTADRERLAARCSASSTTPSRQPPADARVSQRLLLHPGHRHELHRADHASRLSHGDNPTPNLVYTGVLGQDLHRGALFGVLPSQLRRIRYRSGRAERADAHRGSGHRADHRRHHRVEREPQLALGHGRQAVARGRSFLGGSHDIKTGYPVRRRRQRQPEWPQRRAHHLQRHRPPDDRHHSVAVSPGRRSASGPACMSTTPTA